MGRAFGRLTYHCESKHCRTVIGKVTHGDHVSNQINILKMGMFCTTNTHTHTLTHARAHTCTHTHTHIHTHARTHAQHVRTHAHLHARTHTCTHTHTHALTHTHTHTHTHTRTKRGGGRVFQRRKMGPNTWGNSRTRNSKLRHH